ncbi:hypothetical protein SIAM614_24597 [Stappia aggregata IAM 12614]|uniref:Uncharacterized protein n=1 Tax=Roseibium aggregatum (strain ATCC 25650 / DSM 13394 / JCM 20685 / NBRC 16684 / NCIMB 2208 / IAM 12614 / B1) TaxID=384765 RepID=A0NNX6_ROSAI|nr:hypothetical protein SIAM614_24597 [Stappia aggregata IAM 12614] [Roseibium aggregatum IAM 12614]
MLRLATTVSAGLPSPDLQTVSQLVQGPAPKVTLLYLRIKAKL